MTDPYDQTEREARYTICPDCGEDLSGTSATRPTSAPAYPRVERRGAQAARQRHHHERCRNFGNELVITRGVEARGWDFIARALAAVRDFSDFTPDNDPYGEHDFGAFDLDGVKLIWKIDCYDRALEYGSPDPGDAEKTRRVLTILLAEEY